MVNLRFIRAIPLGHHSFRRRRLFLDSRPSPEYRANQLDGNTRVLRHRDLLDDFDVVHVRVLGVEEGDGLGHDLSFSLVVKAAFGGLGHARMVGDPDRWIETVYREVVSGDVAGEHK